MTAAALPRASDRTLPRPLESAIEFLRLLSKRPSGLIGFIGIVFFLSLAFIAPIFVPNQESGDVTQLYETPSLQHFLGTDNAGRDVLNQIVQGGKEIISVALITAFLTTLVATVLGSISALIGGRLDAALVAIADILLTVPPLIVLIVISALARPTNFLALALVLSLLGWAGLMRQVRAQVLTLKERDYVEAARSLDLGLIHIVFREILPNMRSYIVIHFVLAMTGAIYAQVALIILGLVPFSGKNWALMLYFAQTQGAFYFKDAFWFVFSPILAIILLQLSLVLFVNALEDIFNPRLRSS
ncbi:MAG: ABC transporter permease [Chloroflexota bacterium]|nr:ABC transporter permease [Chloroflexota bacterium]